MFQPRFITLVICRRLTELRKLELGFSGSFGCPRLGGGTNGFPPTGEYCVCVGRREDDGFHVFTDIGFLGRGS